jgi:hypothetical protein
MLNSYLAEVSDVYEETIPPPDREGDDPRALRARSAFLARAQGGEPRLLVKREVQQAMPARDAGVIGEADAADIARQSVAQSCEYALRESARNMGGIHPTERLIERANANVRGSEGVPNVRFVPPLWPQRRVDGENKSAPGGPALAQAAAVPPRGARLSAMQLDALPVANASADVAGGAHYGSAALRASRRGAAPPACVGAPVPAAARRDAAIAVARREDIAQLMGQPYGGDRGAASVESGMQRLAARVAPSWERATGLENAEAPAQRGSVVALSRRDDVEAPRTAWDGAPQAAPTRQGAVLLRADSAATEGPARGAQADFAAGSLEGAGPRRCSDNRGHAAVRRGNGGSEGYARRDAGEREERHSLEGVARRLMPEPVGPVRRVLAENDRPRRSTPARPRGNHADAVGVSARPRPALTSRVEEAAP